MDDPVAHLLALRLRYRRNAEARALVDRCLQIVARSLDAGDADWGAIDADVDELRQSLARRFGAPASLRVQ
jgi:hypothetical protein